MGLQMTIYDILCPEKINPIRALAETVNPHYTQSKTWILSAYRKNPGMESFSRAVRKQYCPWGYAGHFGHAAEGTNELDGWEMRNDVIKVWYFDEEGKKQERWYTWQDFADEIQNMIINGEYKEATA